MKIRLFVNFLIQLVALIGMSVPALAINAPVSSRTPDRDYRARMKEKCSPSDFFMTKNGDVYIVNIYGEIFKTNVRSTQWTNLYPNASDFKIINPRFQTIREMADNTLLVSGSKLYNDTLNGIIYRSVDGGKTFDNSSLRTQRIESMFTDEKYTVWAVDADQILYCSVDAGKTWSKKAIYDSVEVSRDTRTTDLFFEEDNKTGYIGTNKRMILKTTDNGKSYTKIPSPKYSENSIYSKVQKIRPFGNHYFIMQEDTVYMSDKDNIHWQKVDTLTWFERGDNGGMLAFTKSNNVVFFDENLNLKWSHKLKPEVFRFYLNLCVRNNKVYFLFPGCNYMSVSETGEDIHPEMFSEDKIDYDLAHIDEDLIYHVGDDIFLADNVDLMCKKPNEPWFRFASLTGKITNVWVSDNDLFVSSFRKKYRVNVAEMKLDPYEANLDDLDDLEAEHFFLCKKKYVPRDGLTELSMVYSEDKGKFVEVASVNTTDDKKALKKWPSKIQASDVNELLSVVKKGMKGEEEFYDFYVTDEEKIEYKKFIDEKVKIGELNEGDREYFHAFVDTIYRIDKSVILNILHDNPLPYVPELCLKSVIAFGFLLPGDEILSVENKYLYLGYYASPWKVSYKGETFVVNHFAVGQLIDKITGGQFLPDQCTKKILAIYLLAIQLQKKQ